MTILPLILALQAVPLPPRSPIQPMPPADWTDLPPLQYVHTADPDVDLSAFVKAEVKAGRCARAVPGSGGWTLSVDLAVLASPQQAIRRVVPRAINCPSIEQYAAGIVSSLARGNVDTEGAMAEGWYRTRLTFSWRS